MENITVKEIVAATGGRLLCGNETQKIAHLSIDSRTMKGNDLFVPLIGEKVDAHRFIEQAFGAGAVAVLIRQRMRSMPGSVWLIPKRRCRTSAAITAAG